MKVLSLFDGISIARHSLELAGIKVDEYYASEIDKFAIQTSMKNYPEIIRLGDVKSVDGKDFEGVDLLVAGFPCQSFSIAGQRKGLDDERGQLVYDLIRILKDSKPKNIILENVASMKKEIQEYLREEFEKATGRKVYINKINASLVSAQNRNRIFFCFKEIPQPQDKGIMLKDILQNDSEIDEKYWYKKPKGNKYRSNQPQDINKEKANTLLVGGDIPSVLLYNQYNNRKMIDKSGTLGTNMGRTNKQGYQVISRIGIRKLTPIECERLQSLQDNFTKGVSDTQRYRQCGNGFNAEVVAHIIKELK